MSQPALFPEPSQAQAAEDAQYYRRVLHTIIDLGTEIAQSIHAQATTPAEPGAPKPDLTIPFERIARTVRRTVLLARKVAEPLPTKAPAQPNRTAARKRIIREVEDAIQRDIWDEPPDRDTLQSELLERLDSPDLDEEISLRDVPDIIKDILRDLGLAHVPGTHPWRRRTPEDLEHLRAKAEAPPLCFRESGVPAPPILDHSGLEHFRTERREHHPTNRDHPLDKDARLTEKPRVCSDPLRSEQTLGQSP